MKISCTYVAVGEIAKHEEFPLSDGMNSVF